MQMTSDQLVRIVPAMLVKTIQDHIFQDCFKIKLIIPAYNLYHSTMYIT